MTKGIRFIRLTLLLFGFLVSSAVVKGQVDNAIHTGEWFKVNSGTELYFIGDYTDSTVTGVLSKPLTNAGKVYFKAGLRNVGVNNVFGNITQSSGLAIFNNATGNSIISGDTLIHFHNLEVSLGANTNYLDLQRYIVVNDTLLMTQGDILLTDSLGLYYASGVSSTTSSGLINETNDNRVFGSSFIRVENYPWNVPGTYSYGKLKGIGLGFTLNDNLGGSPPIIRRYNAIQSCGPSQNSVNRTFKFEDIASTTGQIKNTYVKFHDASELGSNADGTLMHIYKSHNDADSWEDINGTSGVGEVTNSTITHTISDHSVYTVAKDTCDVLPNIQINQIITSTSPFDTLFDISTAMACDPVNLDATLMVQGDPGIYSWLYPDLTIQPGTQNGTITPTALGDYVVILQDIRGCVNMDTVTIGQAPAADASFVTLGAGYCEGVNVPFTPTAAQVGGYTYEWSFGDGATSTTYAPQHTYGSDSIYSVSLTVTTDQGCIDGNNETMVIHPIPTANFSSTAACPGAAVILSNESTANPTQPVTLEWDIFNNTSVDTTTNAMGDGSGGDASYIFSSEGTYNVALTATSNGCQSTQIVQSVTVYPVPEPEFSYASACEGQNVVFTNTSSISDFSALTYNWNFNGAVGPTSTLENPTYPYPSAGTYNVTLEATSNQSCVADTVIAVTVDENPNADFNVTNVCVNNAVTFPDVSTVGAPATITTWAWDYGDASTGNSQNGNNTYTADGTYTVQLTVTTAQGCVGATSKSITIYPGPTIGFSALDGCVDSPIAFQNTTTNATSYKWDFPVLGDTSNNVHENRTFSTDGTHDVHLTATSANGCSSTYTGSVTVFPLPEVELGQAAISTCSTSYLLDANIGNVNAGSSFFWTTGETTSQLDVTYDGNFGVTVTSPQGCVNSDNATITLNSAVIPDLGSDRTICDGEVLDAGYSGAISYSWLPFGQVVQSINVTTTGSYSVSVVDQNGCVGTGSVNITVTTSDPVSLGADQQVACEGDDILLDATTSPTSTYLWNDGSTNDQLNGTSSGYYSVVVTNTAGCISGDTVQLTFESAPTVDLGNDAAYCEQKALNVFVAGANYLWSTGTTQSNELITSSGTYWVDVTNPVTNCTTRDSINLTINDLPTIDLGNDTTLCSYNNITLDAQNAGATYVWNNGATAQTTTIYATGMYSVDVTDANGCTNSGQINVSLNPLFEFDLGPDLPFCTGSVITLDPDAGTNATSFNWYNDSVQLSTSPTYNVPSIGDYFVEVTDTYGCVAVDSITILPSNLSLSAVYLSDSKVFTGDTIQFINLSYPKPYDSNWDFGNGAFSTDSMPTYIYYVPGDYDVELTVDNGNCISSLTKTITVDPAKVPEAPHTAFGNLFSSILELNVYPNPNNGNFNLKIKLENESAIELDMFNMIGQRFLSDKFITKETTKVYSLEHLKAGMYLIRIRNGKETKTIKFIKLSYN